MTETDLRRWLKRILKQYPIIVQPIESHAHSGIPDIFYRTSMVSGWIESKIAEVTKDGTIYVPFRPGQINWLYSHKRLGGKTFLFLVIENRDNGHDLHIIEGYNILYAYIDLCTLKQETELIVHNIDGKHSAAYNQEVADEILSVLSHITQWPN